MKESFEKSSLNKVIRGNKRATYDKEAIDSILKAGFIGYAAYHYEDYAITIPMAYGYREGEIFIHGSMKNRMMTALLNVHRMSFTVNHLDGLVLARSGFHHSVNYRTAILFGMVDQVEGEQEKIAALKMITDQMIPGRWETLRPINQKELNSTLVFKMNITSASAKIRAEGVIDEKEDLDGDTWAGVIPLKTIAMEPISNSDLKKNISVPYHVTHYYNKFKK